MNIPYLTGREGYIVNQLLVKRKIKINVSEKEISDAKKKANDIIDLYLRHDVRFDLYLATSFRRPMDFEKAETNLSKIQKEMPRLKIFCPALCGIPHNAAQHDTHNEKGDIERRIMLHCRAFWGTEMERGTWGKYSEAALFLLEHKPAIFMIKKSYLKIFKERHPIKLVGHPMASHGYHAVATIKDGVRCLDSELEGKMKLKHTYNINVDKTFRSEIFSCIYCNSIIKRSATWMKYYYRDADNIRKNLILDKVRIYSEEEERKKQKEKNK